MRNTKREKYMIMTYMDDLSHMRSLYSTLFHMLYL